MKKIAIILLLVIGGGVMYYFVYYKDENSLSGRYGKKLNNERLKKHLPIVEDSWIIRISDSSRIQWSHKAIFNKRNTPEHIWKTLYFRNSVPFLEEDAFNYDQGDNIGDRLIVVSGFQNPDSLEFRFSRYYYGRYPPSKSTLVNFEFADSVLN